MFVVLAYVFALSLKPKHIAAIRQQRKHIEFRIPTQFTPDELCKYLLLFEGGASQTVLPILVEISHVDQRMTLKDAIAMYPEDAEVSDLSNCGYAKTDYIYCIHLAKERPTLPVTLLRPLNVHYRPQWDCSRGLLNFCMSNEVGNTVVLPNGKKQHLVPTGFAAKKK